MKIAFYDGQGSNTNELLGKGRDKAEADAEQGGRRRSAPFADLSATSEPYADALADRERHRLRHAVPLPRVARAAGAVRLVARHRRHPGVRAGRRVRQQAAARASRRPTPAVRPQGQAPQVRHHRPRELLVPGVGATTPGASPQEAGNDPGVNVKYQLDLSTMSSQANNIIPKLKNDGVTTIVCGCDPVLPVFLSGVANREQYFPEFIIAGTALTDADIVGQLWEPGRSRRTPSASARSSRSSRRPRPSPTRRSRRCGPTRSRPSRSTSSTTRCTCWRSASRAPGPNLTPAVTLRAACSTTRSKLGPGRAVEVRPG